jgi:hypothetical protein
MLTADGVKLQVEQLEAIVAELERGEGDGALPFQAHTRLDLLREQYRSVPESLAGFVEQLADLRRRFEQQIEARVQLVVDRYQAVGRIIEQAEVEKAFLREALIRVSEQRGEGTLQGSAARVSVETSSSARLPPSGSPERDHLVELVKRSGQWEQVSNLSAAKLAAAVRRDAFAPDAQRDIDELLLTGSTHRVVCKAAGHAAVKSQSS